MAAKRRANKFMFEALGKYVLVERVKAETETAGGIILPENSGETPEEGYILSIGNEVTDLQVGDMVLVPAVGQRAVNLDGKNVVIMLEEEVMVRMVN